MYAIEKKENYILVTFEGESTLNDLMDAMEEELERPDYYCMNDIWRIDQTLLLIANQELTLLKRFLLDKYPKNATRTKTAVVTTSGISRTFVEFWVSAYSEVPYEVKLFRSLKEAEKWI